MPTIHDQLLPYAAKLPERPASAATLVVIHCTELPDLATAREYGEKVLYDSGAGNSGHYYVDRDGTTYRYVPGTRVAHHVRGWNPQSIGIELVNTGRYPDWFDSRRQVMSEPYPEAQIGALKALLAELAEKLPALREIAGHEDLDTGMVQASDDAKRMVRRKLDPGILFPWQDVLARCPLRRHASAA